MHSRHTSEDNFICPCNPVNHHVILHKSPFYYSLLAYNSYCLNICLDFTRFQPLVKFWGPFPMCLAPCAWMQEACTLLFNVSRLSASSKCFCLLTTCLPCDGDAALTHWVSWAKCWLGALRSLPAVHTLHSSCFQVTLHPTWAVQLMSSWGTSPHWSKMLLQPLLRQVDVTEFKQ